MKLPLGMLIFWTSKFDKDTAAICGLWYYKEMYVPASIDEKKQCVSDLKNRRSVVLNLVGSCEQIMDLLIQGDQFTVGNSEEILQFMTEIDNAPEGKACVFDDINNANGSSIKIDTLIDVDESIEDIKEQIKKSKPISLNISESWSFNTDLLERLS